MKIIPAIDLLGGRCVRLRQGEESTAVEYSDDPLEMGQRWVEEGASMLHVVNLDGAFGRAGVNVSIIRNMAREFGVPIQLGGGIRSMDDAVQWLDSGVSRVIFGTVAMTAPEIVSDTIKTAGSDRVIVGIDARADRVTIEGWGVQTGKEMSDFALEMVKIGVHRFVFTDVSRDGELSGPNIEDTVALADKLRQPVIASGGFSEIEHFERLLQTGCQYVEGAIIGKALYESRLNLGELLARFESSQSGE